MRQPTSTRSRAAGIFIRRKRGSAAHKTRKGPLEQYTRYLFSKIQPFLKGRICEVGSGCGDMTEFLGIYEAVSAVEPDATAHLTALQRHAYQLNVHCVRCRVEDCPNPQVPEASYDAVFAVNLLEHIEYDITALEIMGDLLKPTGHLIVIVPAYNALYGRLDQQRGHLRRFNRRTLSDAFNDAGLAVTTSFYFNVPALFGWFMCSRVLACRHVPGICALLFDHLVPLIESVERRVALPFGHSLLMVGTRTVG